jgi:pSer/pThr/pTyr-binding forkhead associated (FHA) protein
MKDEDPHAKHRSTAVELKALLQMQRAGDPFLSWRDDTGALQFKTLDVDVRSITIGRAEGRAIRLAWDTAVSALHAELEPREADWLIVDDGLSRNGTFVAGERIRGRRRLRHEDRIVVGKSILVFHAAEAKTPGTELADKPVDRAALSPIEHSVLCALCAPLFGPDEDEPASNQTIRTTVGLSLDGAKRVLTRLYVRFKIPDGPNKRVRLARAAMRAGVVDAQDYA